MILQNSSKLILSRSFLSTFDRIKSTSCSYHCSPKARSKFSRSLRSKYPLLSLSIFLKTFFSQESGSVSTGQLVMIFIKAAKFKPPRQSSSYYAIILQTVSLLAWKPWWKSATFRSFGVSSPVLLESQASKAYLIATISSSLNLEVMYNPGWKSVLSRFLDTMMDCFKGLICYFLRRGTQRAVFLTGVVYFIRQTDQNQIQNYMGKGQGK